MLSVLQLVQSHLHACAYISVLFSDFKENKKTKRARRPQTHAHSNTDTCPVVPFSELIVCYQQMPCSHTHSLHGDAVTAQKFTGHASQLGAQTRSCCSCRKLRLLSNKYTFRAGRRLSRCSPVSVCKCLFVICLLRQASCG